MQSLFTQHVSCPYCGKSFETVVDSSQGEIEYIEDCYICCRPIIFNLQWTDCGNIIVHTRREDD